MKKSEVAKLLAVAAEFDGKAVTAERVELWFAVIGDLDAGDAAEAVRAHYRTSEWPLKPAHVVDGVVSIRSNQAWDVPRLSPSELQLCADSGVPPEEFVHRREDVEWIAHLRSKWQGVES